VIAKLAKSVSPEKFPRTVAPVNCQWLAYMLRFLVVCDTRVCMCVLQRHLIKHPCCL
jgi:hypothetical protein